MRPTLSKLLAILTLTLSVAGEATAGAIPLQNATATFSQTSFGGNPVALAIDGSFAASNAWSIIAAIGVVASSSSPSCS